MSGPSPEARLLELIKGPKARKPWREKIVAVWRRMRAWGAGEDVSPGQWINRGVLLLTILLGLWATVLWTRPYAGAGPGENAAGPEAPEAAMAEPPALNALLRRSLFRPMVVPKPAAPAPSAPAPAAPPPVPKVPLSARTAHWRLTGIMGDGALQAILEDKRRGTTRYVSPGDMLDDLKVEKIFPDRVVISADGETVELGL